MLDVFDSDENVEAFGRKNSEPNASAFPQVLTVVLGECGSHAIVGAAFDKCNASERALAERIIPAVESDMLVTADRNFYSFELWGKFRETGADLLWRVNSNLELPVLKWLPDGSFLSIAFNPAVKRAQRDRIISATKTGADIDPDDGHLVRVVEYDIPDREGNGTGELICVITSILEPSEATAEELAAAYHQRWECENLIDEIKTHQRGPARILRSQSPKMVKQEIWALLLAHYGIRSLMCRAADEIGEDPDRLSFMRSIRVIRRSITGQADFSP